MSDQDHIFMQAAMEEAKKAALNGEVPIGAVLVADGQIVARSGNATITQSDPTAHAKANTPTTVLARVARPVDQRQSQ